jgi:N-acetylglucosaminyldiphosphoundecaprenol N-acetyl-beta-D-mannosaminyltransferase
MPERKPHLTRARPRLEFLDLEFDALGVSEAVDQMEESIRERRPLRIACVNVALLIWARSSAALRAIYRKCDLLLPDGMGIYYGSRLIGAPTSGIINAVFLMDELLRRAAARGYRVYLLGTTPEIIERAVLRLRERHPELAIVGHRDGFFTLEEETDVVREIASRQADILVIGISSIRKDEFLDRQLENLQVPVCLGVGGALDVVAGVRRLAPDPIRRLGLEWLYRLIQEPRRLWKRYLTTNAAFCYLLLLALMRRSLRQSLIGLAELHHDRH